MSDQSNTKLLKQLTTRKRDPKKAASGGYKRTTKEQKAKEKEAKEAEEAKETNPALLAAKASLPTWMKQPSAKMAFDAALFGVTCFVIIKYGKKLAETLDENCPTEKSIMDMMNQ